MITIWIVTRGIYSDRTTLAACSTKDRAEAVKAELMQIGFGPDIDIDEVQLDPPLLAPPAETTVWDVTMGVDGDGYAESVASWGAPEVWAKIATGLQVRGTPGKLWLDGWVLARSEQHAMKLANDHRAQLIATNQRRAPE